MTTEKTKDGGSGKVGMKRTMMEIKMREKWCSNHNRKWVAVIKTIVIDKSLLCRFVKLFNWRHTPNFISSKLPPPSLAPLSHHFFIFLPSISMIRLVNLFFPSFLLLLFVFFYILFRNVSLIHWISTKQLEGEELVFQKKEMSEKETEGRKRIAEGGRNQIKR